MKTLALRSLQTAFIVSAMTFLTGANGQGCGKVVVEEPPQATPTPFEPTPAPQCAAGWHIDQVCAVAQPAAQNRCGDAVDGNEPGAPEYGTKCIGMDDMPAPPPECHDECVPDSPCEPGFVQTEVCEGPTYDDFECGPTMDCAAPEPLPGTGCRLECVPAECPVGSHAEWLCAGGGGSSEPGYPGEEGGSAPSRPVRCMPEPDPQPMPDGPCSMTCVPDSQLCPPGSIEQTTCSTCAVEEPGQDPEPCIAECFTECVPFGAPDEPSEPPQPGAAR
jgi:hypothetical protein